MRLNTFNYSEVVKNEIVKNNIFTASNELMKKGNKFLFNKWQMAKISESERISTMSSNSTQEDLKEAAFQATDGVQDDSFFHLFRSSKSKSSKRNFSAGDALLAISPANQKGDSKLSLPAKTSVSRPTPRVVIREESEDDPVSIDDFVSSRIETQPSFSNPTRRNLSQTSGSSTNDSFDSCDAYGFRYNTRRQTVMRNPKWQGGFGADLIEEGRGEVGGGNCELGEAGSETEVQDSGGIDCHSATKGERRSSTGRQKTAGKEKNVSQEDFVIKRGNKGPTNYNWRRFRADKSTLTSGVASSYSRRYSPTYISKFGANKSADKMEKEKEIMGQLPKQSHLLASSSTKANKHRRASAHVSKLSNTSTDTASNFAQKSRINRSNSDAMGESEGARKTSEDTETKEAERNSSPNKRTKSSEKRRSSRPRLRETLLTLKDLDIFKRGAFSVDSHSNTSPVASPGELDEGAGSKKESKKPRGNICRSLTADCSGPETASPSVGVGGIPRKNDVLGQMTDTSTDADMSSREREKRRDRPQIKRSQAING